ncbi:hypothetical protein BY996DRAFT_6554876 [Phakopsora pachyrhizi]|nr:hypothetical protein BY996DRAFT_6554876 [Phakopsora pachyrhizi]
MQVTTPLISRPKGYSAISHSSLIHDPPTLDTPTKATRAPNLGGLSRSLLGSSLSHLREDEGVGNKKIAIKETSTLNYPSYTNRTLQESSRLPTFSSSSLKTGSEIRKVTAEDVIRAERELLERIAREKNFLENDNVARLVIKGDRGMITDELMQSPENLTNQKDLKKRSVAISGIRSELSKERIRNMVATTTDRGAARMTKIETAKLGGLGDNANGMDLKPNPGRKGHDLKADEIAKEVINAQYNLNTPASHRRASEGTRSERPNLAMEKTFLATPIEAVRSFKYQQPRVALEELKIGYPVSRSNSTNLREDKAKVKQTMERQGMNFCGMQDRDKLKSEISMPLHTTATTSSLVPRGNETGRNKYQASMVDGQGGPSMYGDHYHSLNYSRVGGRPIY